MIDVMKYMRRNYSERPHPCLALVVDVLKDEYKLQELPEDKNYTLRERAALALNVLAARTRQVPMDQCRAGDIVLFDAGGYHVGIALHRNSVLHIPNPEMGVVYERIDSPYIANRIIGVYRPTELSCKT